MKYGIIAVPLATLWGRPSKTAEENSKKISTITDEDLYGLGVLILEEKDNFLKVKTHYGYEGWVSKEEVMDSSLGTLKNREQENFMVVKARVADITASPDVRGVRLKTLYRGALVEVLDYLAGEGYAKVRLLDGREGYLRNIFLEPRKFSQSFLWTGKIPDVEVEEEEFRRKVCERARQYEDVQYRWAGKTPMGLDCSGLTSMAYMLEGVLIYRDAEIKEGWPVKKISLEGIKKGDLLYFPGHIALYLGEGLYIHSTGHKESGGVVYNSLDPKNPLYREDLHKEILAVGTIF